MYRVRILDAATHEFERLDEAVRGRIAERVNWLSARLDTMRPEPLRGELAGLHKLRVGDYRVIYQVLRGEQTIVIHAIGHRREIYRKP